MPNARRPKTPPRVPSFAEEIAERYIGRSATRG